MDWATQVATPRRRSDCIEQVVLLIAPLRATHEAPEGIRKGVAIDGASKLAFGETIYIRGGGVSPGSASDVISKA